MDVRGYHHSESIEIDRSAETVYAIVSEIGRIGELSPVCQSGVWDDPAQGAVVDAWFTGHNVIGGVTWDTRCKVVAADPGRELAWVNRGIDGVTELVRWGFTMEPEGQGTRVTESWQVLAPYPDFVRAGSPDLDDAGVAARIDGMASMARDGIAETLANLKRVAEA